MKVCLGDGLGVTARRDGIHEGMSGRRAGCNC